MPAPIIETALVLVSHLWESPAESHFTITSDQLDEAQMTAEQFVQSLFGCTNTPLSITLNDTGDLVITLDEAYGDDPVFQSDHATPARLQ